MNLDKFFSWIAGIVIAFAVVGKLDVLQMWIWRTQARVVYESRTSTWGSPRFFTANETLRSVSSRKSSKTDYTETK